MRLSVLKLICVLAGCGLLQCHSWGNFWEVGPKIADLTPAAAAVGDTVIISGEHFAPTASANAVKFNGIPTTVSAASETSLTVSVPAGAHSGPVTVSTSEGSGSSPQDFLVLKYYVYVTSSFDSAISAFSIDLNTGALTARGFARFYAGNPTRLGASPVGKISLYNADE